MNTTFIRAIICSSVLIAGCDEKLKPMEKTTLDEHRAAVLNLIKSVPCSGNTACSSIAFGSKACGGPQEYLAYSEALDTITLFKMVETYNAEERKYNQDWSVISDCSIAIPPDSVRCYGGFCAGYYNGIPKPG